MMKQSEQDKQYISRLLKFIREEYAISVCSIIPAKRGYYGETWHIESENGDYFVKIDGNPLHQIKYRNSLEVVEYLCNQGIDFISKIIRTKEGDLYSYFESSVLGVFVWFDGDILDGNETKITEYSMLSKIYPLTKQGFKIPSIEFSDEKALSFFSKWEQLKLLPTSEDDDVILALFDQHKETIGDYADRLSYFSKQCQNNLPPLYITHGDVGGNLIIDNEKHYIIDWDEVMYAPLERDAWGMCCFDWALKAFNDALKQGDISYELRPECLAFYCYHMFFLFLCEFLDDYIQYGKKQEIEGYFNSWIMERMKYADSVH